MVNLTIDGQKVSVPQGQQSVQAAATVGIEIPACVILKASTKSVPARSA